MSFVSDTLSLLAKHEPKAHSVGRIGLSAEQVRKMTASARAHVAPTATEIRDTLNTMARTTRAGLRGKTGRRGLPDHVVTQMHVVYLGGKSLSQVAAIFGGTRQSVFEVFRHRGLPMRKRKIFPKIAYNGRHYAMGKDYFRATSGDRKPLHHAKWEDANGPIPEGWSVGFKNADATDLRPENLFCAPLVEVTLYHHRRLTGAAA